MNEKLEAMYQEAFALEVRDCADALREVGGYCRFGYDSSRQCPLDEPPSVIGRYDGDLQMVVVHAANLDRDGYVHLLVTPEKGDGKPRDLLVLDTTIAFGHLMYVTYAIKHRDED